MSIVNDSATDRRFKAVEEQEEGDVRVECDAMKILRGVAVAGMFLVLVIACAAQAGGTATSAAHLAKKVKLTILSTMLADEGIGEWGFAALLEVDGKAILVDTGARPDTVLKNAAELKVDLAGPGRCADTLP